MLGPEPGQTLRDSEIEGGFTKSGFNASLSLMQPLYAGVRIVTGNKLAKVGIKAAELKHLEELLDILYKDVTSAIDAGVATSSKPNIDKIVLSDRLSSLLAPSDYYIPELEKKLTLGGYLPAAAVGISYGYSSFTNSNYNAIGIATISIPISNWGKGSRKLKRLNNEIIKAQNEKDHLTSQLILQARQLWLNLNVAWEQMKVAEEFTITEKKTGKEKDTPLEHSVTAAYTGVLRTHTTSESPIIYIGQSERHSLHNPANQRNLERDKEEVPFESEEL